MSSLQIWVAGIALDTLEYVITIDWSFVGTGYNANQIRNAIMAGIYFRPADSVRTTAALYVFVAGRFRQQAISALSSSWR